MEWNLEMGRAALERMKTRTSCRVFANEPIPDELLHDLLEVGIRAASGGNLQPYSILVVKDEEKRKELARLNGDQQFMAKAPVSLIFLLDWYKTSRLAKLQKAPFTAPQSYMHYLIGLEDLMCAAQSIETAAWQMGIGSVYIGTVNGAGKEIAEIYNLPPYTYPVLILSMGYPRTELPPRERLPYEMTVFEERYPDWSDEEILEGFAVKIDKVRALPASESVQEEWKERFLSALLTSYTPEEADELIREVWEKGYFEYLQFVFGLHYHAKQMPEHGKKVMEMLKDQGLQPFAKLLDNEE